MKASRPFKMHLLDLPGTDIILKIIGYLSPTDWLHFRIVCKETYFLVHEYFKYMKYLNVSHHQVFPQSLCQVFLLWHVMFSLSITEYFILQILPHQCQSLQFFKIPNSSAFNDEAVKNILQNNHNLSHLDLSNSNLKNGALQPLVVNCKVSNCLIANYFQSNFHVMFTGININININVNINMLSLT